MPSVTTKPQWNTPQVKWGIYADDDGFAVVEWVDGEWLANCSQPTERAAESFIEAWIKRNTKQ